MQTINSHNGNSVLPHTVDCIEPGGPCDVNAICEELPGRNNFTCTCMPMFVGDGFVCERRKCSEEMKNKELDIDAFTIEV